VGDPERGSLIDTRRGFPPLLSDCSLARRLTVEDFMTSEPEHSSIVCLDCLLLGFEKAAPKQVDIPTNVIGDTSCTDHFVAWRVRHLLQLDHLTSVSGVTGDLALSAMKPARSEAPPGKRGGLRSRR